MKIVRLYLANKIVDNELAKDTFTIGNKKADFIIDNPLFINKLSIKLDNDSYELTGLDSTINNTRHKLNESVLLSEKDNIALIVFESAQEDLKVIDLNGVKQVKIGRKKDNDVSIDCSLISREHLLISKENDLWVFKSLNPNNPIYLNGESKLSGTLNSNDVLVVGLSQVTVINNIMSVIYHGTVKSNIVHEKQVKTIETTDDDYPYLIKKTPRLLEDLPQENIEIEAAPSIGEKPKISWVNIMVSPLLTMSGMLAISVLTGTISLFYIPTAIIGIVMGFINYNSQKKGFKTAEEKRKKLYSDYLEKKEKEILDATNKQKNILNSINPSTLTEINNTLQVDRKIWDRGTKDSDFLQLRLGSGKIDNLNKVSVPKKQLKLTEDEYDNTPDELKNKYEKIDDCPITVSLANSLSMGVIGNHKKSIEFIKNLIIDATYHQDYNDLKIIIVCDEEETKDFEFARWLPHIYDEDRQIRYFVNNNRQSAAVFEHLAEVFVGRKMEKSSENEFSKKRIYKPNYLLLCTSVDIISKSKIAKFLNDENLGISAIYGFDSLSDLPDSCQYIVGFDKNTPYVYNKENSTTHTEFKVDSIDELKLESYSRAMAPFRTEKGSGSKQLPTSVTFLEGYGVKKPSDIDLKENWEKPLPETSMAVPVGVDVNGKPFMFDINEKAYGPHGLVAGMTGSGKSEMVQTWILSMALKFPPNAVSFVLIDFKGTGLILPFEKLPHLAGTISDLDKNISRNLVALENEMTRRKALFDQYGVSNIKSYLKLYHSGKAKEALPYLFIVIDEFAEFKVAFPDFMVVIDRVFGIGRTLGIHTILLTQKPTGAIDDKMAANTRFRWCLKVASSADSREMLNHTDAAKITNPGRAYVQVGEDEVFEEIQSYYSGANYNPYRKFKTVSDKVSLVNLYGEKQRFDGETTTGLRSNKNEIDAIVEYIDNYVKDNNIERAKSIWTEKLPNRLYLNELLKIGFDGNSWPEVSNELMPIVGMIDDPHSQSQYPWSLDLKDNSVFALYGAPGTGKTTFLHTLIMSIALSYTPSQAHIYLMDFGGGSLNQFKDLPHVGDAALGNDKEKILKLASLLEKEIKDRQSKISKNGFVSIDSYREYTKDNLANIVLILDNFGNVLDSYPELTDFFINYSREGGGVGMYFVTTANAQNGITYRVSQNIKLAAALQLSDKGEYISIVGNSNGLVPENIPGRGLLKGNPILEFQAALPSKGKNEIERIAVVKEVIKNMNDNWKGEKVANIEVMPEKLSIDDYSEEGILLGVNYKDIKPIKYNLDEEKNLLFIGNDNEFSNLYKQINDKSSIQIINSDDNDFEDKVKQLATELDNRKKTKKEDSSIKFDSIMILIKDYRQVLEKIDDKTLKILTTIAKNGKGLGVFFVVQDVYENINSLYQLFELLILTLINDSLIVVSSTGAKDYGLPVGEIPYSERNSLAYDDGYYYDGNSTIKIRLFVDKED